MKQIVFFTFLHCLAAAVANGQGCSDAGFCSFTQHSQPAVILENEFVAGAVYGIGEENVQVATPYISYIRRFGKNWQLNSKITSSYFNGDVGSVFGAGDIYSIAGYSQNNADKQFRWQFSGGIKIPLTAANMKINRQPIPMAYQSSLGTYDFIGSAGLKVKKLDFTTAIQVPFINRNKNSYFDEFSGHKGFPSTNLFKRQPDVLFRGGYTFKKKNWTLNPNILNILHTGKDTYENIYGKRTAIEGSAGLTVNLNLITRLAFKNQNYFEVSIAAPVVVREVRPDGLTRALTIGIEYHFLQ